MTSKIKNTWPAYSIEEANKTKKILLSGKVNYWTGAEGRKFEEEFSCFVGTKYAIAVANGTVAIDLALHALEIKKNDEILVTSRTFLASVSSIINAGAVPKFVDICPDSQNIDVTLIKKNITKKTKAILCVHLAGWPCDMDEIISIAKKYNLKVIEDCAQAHGAVYKGKSVGSIGDIGCWSFCQDKIMTTGGEGGMLTTNSKTLWEKMWSYKDHGKSFNAVYKKKHPPGFRWLHESFGSNYRLTELQSAIGRLQIRKMADWTSKRNNNLKKIWDTCSNYSFVRLPTQRCKSCECDYEKIYCVHAGYKAYIFIQKNKLKKGWDRDRLIAEIEKRGVPCFTGSCSEVYLEKAFEKTTFKPKKRLKKAKQLGEESMMFLIHPTLKLREINMTCKVIESVFNEAKK